MRPAPELTEAEKKQVKKVAESLLELLKREKLFLGWRKELQARAAVEERPSVDDLERLKAMVRALMVTISRNPALGELLHPEGIGESGRAELTSESGLFERLAGLVELLDRLHTDGVVRATQLRELWLLIQGAVAPLRFQGLSEMFDQVDGPVDADELIGRVSAAIMRGMRVDD